MKILNLLCFPLYGSGSGTYARKLCEKMAQAGDTVGIVTPDHRPIKGVKIFEAELPFFAAFTGHSEHPNCKMYADLTAAEITELMAAFYKATLEAVEKFKPDIIFVHHASFFVWIANYLRVIYNIPFIVIEHGTGILNSTLDRRYLPLTKDGLRRADSIICVSGDTKKWYFKVYGRKQQNKMKVIPGGVDLELYNHLTPVKTINKKYHLENKKVVIFVGKLTTRKGVIYLVKAATLIKAEIFILGSGDEKENLEKYITDNDIKNVHMLGYFGSDFVKELKEFYCRADVLVIPSIWDEPLGLVVLEAMASGTPVVGSKKGGIPLAVKDKQNGFLVRARSAKAISEAVNKILKNPALHDKMAEAARKTVEEKFSWTLIAARFEKLAKTILETNNSKMKNKKFSASDIKRGKKELKGRIVDYR